MFSRIVYTARRHAAWRGTCYGTVSVRPSVTSQSFIKTAARIELVFGTDASIDLLSCTVVLSRNSGRLSSSHKSLYTSPWVRPDCLDGGETAYCRSVSSSCVGSYCVLVAYPSGGLVAEWLACWTQAQYGFKSQSRR